MDRPFVYINMAMTADGKITSARREYPRFASLRDRERMDRLRAEADALLVGAGTLRADNPKLHVRSEMQQAYRASLGKPPGLMRVLVTASGKIDPEGRFFDDTEQGAGRIIATTDGASGLEALAERVEILRLGAERVDLGALLRNLKARGIERLLCEGGAELNWQLVRDDLVDELHVTIAPALLGGRGAPTILEGEGFPMASQRRLKLAELLREEDEIYCRWTVLR